MGSDNRCLCPKIAGDHTYLHTYIHTKIPKI